MFPRIPDSHWSLDFSQATLRCLPSHPAEMLWDLRHSTSSHIPSPLLLPSQYGPLCSVLFSYHFCLHWQIGVSCFIVYHDYFVPCCVFSMPGVWCAHNLMQGRTFTGGRGNEGEILALSPPWLNYKCSRHLNSLTWPWKSLGISLMLAPASTALGVSSIDSLITFWLKFVYPVKQPFVWKSLCIIIARRFADLHPKEWNWGSSKPKAWTAISWAMCPTAHL